MGEFRKGKQPEYPTEDEIKAVISGYRMWVGELQERIGTVSEELWTLGENKKYGEASASPQMEELSSALILLEDQRIRIRRIFLAYMTLPLEEFQILHSLYEEKIPWRRISQHLGISKQKAVARRNQALAHIREQLPPEERRKDRDESGVFPEEG